MKPGRQPILAIVVCVAVPMFLVGLWVSATSVGAQVGLSPQIAQPPDVVARAGDPITVSVDLYSDLPSDISISLVEQPGLVGSLLAFCPDAETCSYSMPSVPLTDDGMFFWVDASNAF